MKEEKKRIVNTKKGGKAEKVFHFSLKRKKERKKTCFNSRKQQRCSFFVWRQNSQLFLHFFPANKHSHVKKELQQLNLGTYLDFLEIVCDQNTWNSLCFKFNWRWNLLTWWCIVICLFQNSYGMLEIKIKMSWL